MLKHCPDGRTAEAPCIEAERQTDGPVVAPAKNEMAVYQPFAATIALPEFDNRTG